MKQLSSINLRTDERIVNSDRSEIFNVWFLTRERAVHLMFQNYKLFSHVCAHSPLSCSILRYQKTKRVKLVSVAGRASRLIRGPSLTVRRRRVLLTRGQRLRLPNLPRQNYAYVVATCRTRDYAQGPYALRPSTPPPVPLHPARFGEHVVWKHTTPRAVSTMVVCFGQVASCINHTSGEHKMSVAWPNFKKA